MASAIVYENFYFIIIYPQLPLNNVEDLLVNAAI